MASWIETTNLGVGMGVDGDWDGGKVGKLSRVGPSKWNKTNKSVIDGEDKLSIITKVDSPLLAWYGKLSSSKITSWDMQLQ